MTGLDLKRIMERNHLSLRLAAVRISCILEYPVSDRNVRGWFSGDSELDPKITEEAILSHHGRAPYVWEGAK